MEPLIKTEKLGILFDEGKPNEYLGLKDINIQIFPKEYIVFFGPSGSGKSTLLNILLGLLSPTEGKVYLKGREYGTFTEKERNRRTSLSFGMIFQQFNLLFSLSVIDNVTLPQVLIGRPGRERKEKAMKLLRRFGMEARATRMPGQLSGGQQQRVAVCRALVNDPDIILADEPVGNLDSESAKTVMNTLKEINLNDQKTVILVTHDPRYLAYADRVYYFEDAHIIREEKGGGAKPEDLSAKATSLESDLEKLARVHHDLSSAELKAWSVSSWLMDEFVPRQEERLEKAMERLLKGQISLHGFFEELDRSFHKGGVGLYRPTAIEFAKRVGRLLHEMQLYSERYGKADNDTKKSRLAAMLESFLLEEHSGALGDEARTAMSKAISERIENKISHDEFAIRLTGRKLSGGVGLAKIAAERISTRLDLIMSGNKK